MRARILVTLAAVTSLATLALALGVLQPTVSTAAPDAGICVSIGVPNPEPPSAAEAAELKRAEAEIGKPIARYTIGEQHCFATDAEAQEFLRTLNKSEPSAVDPQESFAPLSYVVAHLYEHADYNQYASGRADY